MQPDVRVLFELGMTLGEGPLYDYRTGDFLWLDIKGGRLFRLGRTDQAPERIETENALSSIALSANGQYLATDKHGFHACKISTDGVTLTPISDPEVDKPGNRFNDGKVDPFGRYWAGTMDNAEVDTTAGSWWCLDKTGYVHKAASRFHVTNGPVFDRNLGRGYFTDSARQTIYKALINGAHDISPLDLNVFIQFGDGDGYPDGMTLDAEGCLWVAFWAGSCVRRISPDAEILLEISVPAQQPTSCAFGPGGLYVTSAAIGLEAPTSADGSLMLIDVDTSLAVHEPLALFG